MTTRKFTTGNAATLAILLLVVAALGGCTQAYVKDMQVPSTPRYITPPQRTVGSLQTTDGSLYMDGSRVAQINDFRAYDINDLVTIKVVESTTASNGADISTAKKDSSNRSLTSLLGLQNKLLPRSVDPTSALDAATDEAFDSTGNNKRSETLTSTLTARVVDRLPNGNLVIQAAREVIVNDERQVMIVQGIVRPADIDGSNSINSSKIADLQIQYGGTGIISENLRRGWLSRIISYVWPF